MYGIHVPVFVALVRAGGTSETALSTVRACMHAHIGCSGLLVPTEVFLHRTVPSQPASRPTRSDTRPRPPLPRRTRGARGAIFFCFRAGQAGQGVGACSESASAPQAYCCVCHAVVRPVTLGRLAWALVWVWVWVWVRLVPLHFGWFCVRSFLFYYRALSFLFRFFSRFPAVHK